MKDTATLTLRVSTELLKRIDRAAAEHQETRTQYVLRWLPISYDDVAEQPAASAETAQNNGDSSAR